MERLPSSESTCCSFRGPEPSAQCPCSTAVPPTSNYLMQSLASLGTSTHMEFTHRDTQTHVYKSFYKKKNSLWSQFSAVCYLLSATSTEFSLNFKGNILNKPYSSFQLKCCMIMSYMIFLNIRL